MEMSLTYSKERVAFGVPIGSFQIIQHYMVDMSVDVDSIQWAVYHAAWTLGEGLPTSTKSASTVKAYTSEAYQRICYKAHMIHAAIGFTKDHDLELYTRRAKVQELFFGDADYHLEVVAQQLGL
jgi:alkylation response protein AidB-like acyl-CoA dehydrogenase